MVPFMRMHLVSTWFKNMFIFSLVGVKLELLEVLFPGGGTSKWKSCFQLFVSLIKVRALESFGAAARPCFFGFCFVLGGEVNQNLEWRVKQLVSEQRITREPLDVECVASARVSGSCARKPKAKRRAAAETRACQGQGEVEVPGLRSFQWSHMVHC